MATPADAVHELSTSTGEEAPPVRKESGADAAAAGSAARFAAAEPAIAEPVDPRPHYSDVAAAATLSDALPVRRPSDAAAVLSHSPSASNGVPRSRTVSLAPPTNSSHARRESIENSVG